MVATIGTDPVGRRWSLGRRGLVGSGNEGLNQRSLLVPNPGLGGQALSKDLAHVMAEVILRIPDLKQGLQ